MIRSRETLEEIEASTLAPWAQQSAASAGRQHSEPRHPLRTEYQRDRARIIHSRAFRRLEYKTQVFLNGSGDHFRTRLTHTIEVASVTRAIAQALGLNADLAEAIALAHDLGHPPFGHSGEETLNELMRDHGGFEHNAQSVRIVELIEIKYPGFPGLNLTYEVLEGLRKHAASHTPPNGRSSHPSPSLEAQVANLADEIAYSSHDIEDGLEAGLIDPEHLETVPLWREQLAEVHALFPRLKGRALHNCVIRNLIDRQVNDVVRTSARAIARAGVRSVEDVRRHPKPLIRYSSALARANRALRRFLYRHLYEHPAVAGVNQSACSLLRDVFHACEKNPRLLGGEARRRIQRDGFHRAACDYLSGMTDRYLIEAWHRWCSHDGHDKRQLPSLLVRGFTSHRLPHLHQQPASD